MFCFIVEGENWTSVTVERAKMDGQISGVIPHLVEDGLSILQYADDTILFLDQDLDKARNLKLLLCDLSCSNNSSRFSIENTFRSLYYF